MTDPTKQATVDAAAERVKRPIGAYLHHLSRLMLSLIVAAIAMWAYGHWPRGTVGIAVFFQVNIMFATLDMLKASSIALLQTVSDVLQTAVHEVITQHMNATTPPTHPH